MKKIIVTLIGIVGLVSGCATSVSIPPTPTATFVPPTMMPEPTASATLAPTNTPIPTSTPTATPVPTNTPLPTNTPTPTTASTSTPAPTPTPQHPEGLASVIGKEYQAVVLTLPDMDAVRVANIPYRTITAITGKSQEITMDVYYPPGFNFESSLPVVIFVNGFNDPSLPEPLKDYPQYISWGALTAASGMVAITYETRSAVSDIYTLLDYIIENSDWLGIDHTRIVLWSCSGNVVTAQGALRKPDYQEYLRGVVFYYGPMLPAGKLPQDVPLFVVKAVNDLRQIKDAIDKFVTEARAQNVPLEFIEFAGGTHGFDANLDTDESREVIAQTLEFMRACLFEE